MANFWSRKSRAAAPEKDRFRGEDQEWLLSYCKEVVQQQPEIDYFIFGHRHLPLDFMVNAHSRYVNLGDWFEACTYAVLRDGKLELKSYS